MTTKTVRLDRDGAVATITLNRPDNGNAINIPLARELHEAAIQCRLDDSVRCVVLTGAGRMFCVGGDITCFADAGDAVPALLEELTTHLHGAMAQLSRMNKPLVTAVNGPAAGAGLGLAVLGDIALATPAAHFTLAYPAIGLTPDGGATWLLPRLMGLRKFQEFALTNKRLSAEEAESMDLVTRVVAAEDLGRETGTIAGQLAQSATGALGKIRQLVMGSYGTSLEAQMEAEATAIAEAGAKAEAREGFAAFLDKRKPDFTRC